MTSVLSGEQLVRLQAKTDYELPSSGPKEFEPNNSWLEQRQIHSALEERKALLEQERVEKWNLLMEAEWIPEKHKAEVKRKNKHWEVFGHHSDGKDWLFPEEVLLLMEMNCLQCHFGGVPLSIQKGYSLLLRPEGGCSPTEYRVYSHLSRVGYRIVRHLPSLTVTSYERQLRLDQHLQLNNSYDQQPRVITVHEPPRPELLPKKTVDLSNGSEVLNKASSEPSDQPKQCSSNKVSAVLPDKNVVKPTIEVIDLLDSSSEESSSNEEEFAGDSDIEIVEEIPVSKTSKSHTGYDDDDDIVEIPVPKKEIIVETIVSSDSEEEASVSESESNKSCDGNWKRIHRVKKKPFVRPASLANFSFLAAEEFCSDRKMKLENHSDNNVNDIVRTNNIKGESLECSDSVEFVRIQPQSVRTSFCVDKTRNEILDMMPSMAKQKIMTLESPDPRLIPSNIKLRQSMYTFNTNSLRARVFSNFRPSYRGRRNFQGQVYNNFNNSINSFNSLQIASNPLLPNSALTQLFGSDVQSVARGMIQFASSILNNSFMPQNTPNRNILPYNFHSTQPSSFNGNRFPSRRSIFDLPQRPFTNQAPLIHRPTSPRNTYNEPPWNNSTPTHIRFSDSLTVTNDNSHQAEGFGNEEIDSRASERYEHRPRFIPRIEGRRENRDRRKMNYRGHFKRASSAFSNSVSHRREPNRGEPFVDPAYSRPDVPAPANHDIEDQKGNFIPLSVQGQQSEDIIDILDDDDNFTPSRSVSNRFERKRKKKFQLLQKQMKALKTNDKNAPSIVFLDSPPPERPSIGIPVKVEEANTSIVSVKSETSAKTTNIKQEAGNLNLPDNVKKETSNELPVNSNLVAVKVEGIFEIDQIKCESNGSVKVKLEHEDLLKEAENETPINNSVPLVKTEPSLLTEASPTDSTTRFDEEMEVGDGSTANSVSADLPTPHVESDSVILEKEDVAESNLMEVANESESCKNTELNLAGSAEDNSNNISSSNLRKTPDTMVNEEEVVCAENEMEIDEIDADSELIRPRTSGEKINIKNTSEVRNWSEMKKNNVSLLERREEIRDIEEEIDEDSEKISPLIRPRQCQSIGSVLSALQIFKPFTPKVPEDLPKLKITFDMYLSSDFRKAQRGLPQYRIVVFKGSEAMPSAAELYELQTRFQDKVQVLRAVVMPDSVVFYNCSSVSLPVYDHLLVN